MKLGARPSVRSAVLSITKRPSRPSFSSTLASSWCLVRTKSSKPQFNIPSDVSQFDKYKRTDTPAQMVDESVAKDSPALTTLHARLNLGPEFPLATLARSLVCIHSDPTMADNYGMALFGMRMIYFQVHSKFTSLFPRLPPVVIRHIISTYSEVSTLAAIGKSWGIEIDERSDVQKLIKQKLGQDSPLLDHRHRLGKLLYVPKTKIAQKGVTEIASSSVKGAISTDNAYATAVRAIVAGVYAHKGLEATKEFVSSHIIRPRPLDVSKLLGFQQPTRELAVLCAREGLEPPAARLMAETGRFSRAPVYVVGVFSGADKLGEGQGASLREAKTRAAVNALKGWYLYSPHGDNSRHDHGVVVM